MIRYLIPGLALALAAPGALAQTSGTPPSGVYDGTLFVTGTSGTCSSSDPSTGKPTHIRLNNSSTTELTFASYEAESAAALSLPWTTQGTVPTSGTLTINSIGGDTLLKSPQTESYTAPTNAITLLDSTTNVISFTFSYTKSDGCTVAVSGALAPAPSSPAG